MFKCPGRRGEGSGEGVTSCIRADHAARSDVWSPDVGREIQGMMPMEILFQKEPIGICFLGFEGFTFVTTRPEFSLPIL